LFHGFPLGTDQIETSKVHVPLPHPSALTTPVVTLPLMRRGQRVSAGTGLHGGNRSGRGYNSGLRNDTGIGLPHRLGAGWQRRRRKDRGREAKKKQLHKKSP
jgi:hypothetical protein